VEKNDWGEMYLYNTLLYIIEFILLIFLNNIIV